MSASARVVFITGAARGIGYATARYFVERGDWVMMADIEAEGLEQACLKLEEEIEEQGALKGRVAHVFCDVTRQESVEHAIEETIQTFGRGLNVCVANAAVVKSAPFLELTEEDFTAVIDVNLKGVFLTCQAAARAMVRDSGDDKDAVRSIVTMSSANAVTAIPAITGYNAAKGGVNNLTRNMALSLAPHGIRVNAVAPGSIMTEMLSKVASDESVMKGILMRTPLSRVGDPSEVASVIDFLGSKASSYMTGQILYCDGGRNALNYVVDVSQESLEAATKAADAFRIGTS
jgi:NAD(P)-dependent dehydrogenase (short-subunit alcohol dehydrogenase family)